MATYVPYGEQSVPYNSGMEPDQNDTCPYCSTALEWYPEPDDYGVPRMRFDPPVYTDDQGTHWCSARCELLARLDQRPFFLQRIRDAIAFDLPCVAAMYARQLATFALAFEFIEALTEGGL
jgi:hypothetical protein